VYQTMKYFFMLIKSSIGWKIIWCHCKILWWAKWWHNDKLWKILPRYWHCVQFTSKLLIKIQDKEKDPLVKAPLFDYTITHMKKDSEDIDGLMRRLGEVVRKHRLLLKPFFQDKDISKIGRVSFTRMRSILDNNKIPLNDHQYNLLCKNFGADVDEFNYVDFI